MPSVSQSVRQSSPNATGTDCESGMPSSETVRDSSAAQELVILVVLTDGG